MNEIGGWGRIVARLMVDRSWIAEAEVVTLGGCYNKGCRRRDGGGVSMEKSPSGTRSM